MSIEIYFIAGRKDLKRGAFLKRMKSLKRAIVRSMLSRNIFICFENACDFTGTMSQPDRSQSWTRGSLVKGEKYWGGS